MMSTEKLGTARLLLSVGVALMTGACTSVESSGDGSVLEVVDAHPQPSIPDAALSPGTSEDAPFAHDLASGSGDLLLASAGPSVDSAWPAIECNLLGMVWRLNGEEIRRDFYCGSGKTSSSGFCYSFADDACLGYRCLDGNDISSACFSEQECPLACNGRCLAISSMRTQCVISIDGGAAIDGPVPSSAEVGGPPPFTAPCGQKDMIWRDSSGGVIRRDVGCDPYGTDFSGCYSLADDRCDGYRCLQVGTEFSSSCTSLSQCQEICEGLCIHIASQRDRCLGSAGSDGGRPFERD